MSIVNCTTGLNVVATVKKWKLLHLTASTDSHGVSAADFGRLLAKHRWSTIRCAVLWYRPHGGWDRTERQSPMKQGSQSSKHVRAHQTYTWLRLWLVSTRSSAYRLDAVRPRSCALLRFTESGKRVAVLLTWKTPTAGADQNIPSHHYLVKRQRNRNIPHVSTLPLDTPSRLSAAGCAFRHKRRNTLAGAPRLRSHFKWG